MGARRSGGDGAAQGDLAMIGRLVTMGQFRFHWPINWELGFRWHDRLSRPHHRHIGHQRERLPMEIPRKDGVLSFSWLSC